ncbi:rCG59980, partial [Rattus norvegicus]
CTLKFSVHKYNYKVIFL